MIVYITLLFLLLIGTLLEIKIKKSLLYSKIFYVILIFIISFRYQIGVDWIGYELYYGKYSNTKSIESGFLYLYKIFRNIGLNLYFSNFIISLFSMSILYKFFKKNISMICLPLTLFFYRGFIYLSIEQIRQFLALSFFLLGLDYLLKKEKKMYIIYILIGSLFHTSILITLILLFYKQVKLTKSKLIIVFILGIILSIFNNKIGTELLVFFKNMGFLNGSFFNKAMGYLKIASNNGIKISISYIERNLIYLLTIFYLSKKELNYKKLNFFIIMYSIYIFLSNFFVNIPNMSLRLSYYFIFGMIFCVSYILIKIKDYKIPTIIIIFYFIISTVYFSKNKIYLKTLVPYKNYVIHVLLLDQYDTGRDKTIKFWDRVRESK